MTVVRPSVRWDGIRPESTQRRTVSSLTRQDLGRLRDSVGDHAASMPHLRLNVTLRIRSCGLDLSPHPGWSASNGFRPSRGDDPSDADYPGGWEDGRVSEQPSRYTRSFGGMTGALIVTVLFVLAFVAWRGLFRADVDDTPVAVDWQEQRRARPAGRPAGRAPPRAAGRLDRDQRGPPRRRRAAVGARGAHRRRRLRRHPAAGHLGRRPRRAVRRREGRGRRRRERAVRRHRHLADLVRRRRRPRVRHRGSTARRCWSTARRPSGSRTPRVAHLRPAAPG